MTTFTIKIIAECPSDWTEEQVRGHLRKAFTKMECMGATIEDQSMVAYTKRQAKKDNNT